MQSLFLPCLIIFPHLYYTYYYTRNAVVTCEIKLFHNIISAFVDVD